MKILKRIASVLLVLLALLFIARGVGRNINNMTPKDGVNESMYVDIGGSRQWINIYGQDRENPVLLYLHGGPGSATSAFDYVITRPWSDVYTVVTWDQRGCGKSYDPSRSEAITADIMMQDGREMTEFLREHLGVDRITLLGHSWGSYFGANLALAYPEYYAAFIGAGQFIDEEENESRLYEAALAWSEDDPEGRAMVEDWGRDPFSLDGLMQRNGILKRYGYDMMKDGTDYNRAAAVLFNPNYSLKDLIAGGGSSAKAMEPYLDFISTGLAGMSLQGRYDYQIPFYNINGDMDYQTNFDLACDYFSQVNAPRKRLFVLKNATHGLLESRSREFSKIVHEIASLEKER